MDAGKAQSSALPTTICECAGHVNLLAPRTSFSTGSFLVSLILHGGCFCFLTGGAFSSILERGTEVKIRDFVSTSGCKQRGKRRVSRPCLHLAYHKSRKVR